MHFLKKSARGLGTWVGVIKGGKQAQFVTAQHSRSRLVAPLPNAYGMVEVERRRATAAITPSSDTFEVVEGIPSVRRPAGGAAQDVEVGPPLELEG